MNEKTDFSCGEGSRALSRAKAALEAFASLNARSRCVRTGAFWIRRTSKQRSCRVVMEDAIRIRRVRGLHEVAQDRRAASRDDRERAPR